MTEQDPTKTDGRNPFEAVLRRVAEADAAHEQPGARSETSERVEARLDALRQAVLGDWPTVEEMRQLPFEEFTALLRQLSLFTDRLTSLRLELLAGKRPKL